MDKPFVSILIPCYNAEQWVGHAIKSSLDQTYEHKEIIVVDDGSTDNSWEIIKNYSTKIKIEKTPNKGAGATRNHLLKLSKGEWIQYLDADDLLLPEKIDKQINFLKINPDADVIFSPVIIESLWVTNIKRSVCPIPEQNDTWILHVRWDLPQTGAVLWRKQALLDVGGWNKGQPCCQENELYFRLLKAGKKFYYWPEPDAVYRKWSSDTVCERNNAETFRQRLKIIDESEQFLEETGKLSGERQDHINQARFECARIIWNFDKSWAKRVIREIQDTNAPFVPQGAGVPPLYRFIYSVLGFTATEMIADMRRKLFY